MQIRKIKIQSKKGAIAATIHLPVKQSERLAILCPGYLDSKDHAHLVSLSNDLSTRGFTVVRFDPIGTWESEGDISDYTNTQYLDDIKSVIEYMLNEGSYNYILLGGHSRGGQISLLYAARDPRISQVLAIEPSTHKTMVGKRYSDWKELGYSSSTRDIPGTKNGKHEFKVPYSHVEDRKLYDVVGDVKKIKVPIVLIAGETDTIVLPEHVKEIFESANEPKKYILIPNIGHDYRFRDAEISVVNKEILKALGI